MERLPENPPPLPSPPGAAVRPLRPRVVAALAAGGFLLGVVALRRWPPAVWPVRPKCAVRELTGLNCPGCGATRAVSAALRGDFQEAAARNPAFVALAGLVAAWAAWAMIVAPAFGLRSRWRPSARWLWAALAALAVFGVLRNFPGFERLGP